MYFNTNAGLKPLVVSDEILHEALDVMSGELTSVYKSKLHGAFVLIRRVDLHAIDATIARWFTCCRLGHPNGDPCDREALMLPMLGLYADVYAERNGKHADAYALIEPLKHRLFPETFEYVHKGHDGVETTTTHVLFGDLVAAVEETIDDNSARTKDFKPGTNAQRHRFYHVQQHRRSSDTSTISGLMSMIHASFRRANVSGVDNKEPAASEPPVAAQPAARRQLTWRASAPDYGTI